jgi:hypothetical protein
VRQRSVRQLRVIGSRDHDHGQPVIGFSQAREYELAGRVRQTDVYEHDVRLKFREQPKGLGARARQMDNVV